MPRNNVYCDQCRKTIGDEKLAYFSDVKKDLDFCSEDCYSKWVSCHNIQECNAQDYLNQKYPVEEERKNVKKLDISNQKLEGDLDLSDFINLETLDCSHNKLTNLDLTNLTQLEEIRCNDNY